MKIPREWSRSAKTSVAVLVALLTTASALVFLAPRRIQDAGEPGRDPAGIQPYGFEKRLNGAGDAARGPAIVPVDPRIGTLMEFADYLESNGVTGRHVAQPSSRQDADSP